jgi:hypothetical protein
MLGGRGHNFSKTGFGPAQTVRTPSRQENLKECFISRSYPVPESEQTAGPARANRDLSEDYTPVFLSHARI